MWNKNKENNRHVAVINKPDTYTIISLIFNSKTNLFTLDNYQHIKAEHGEFGPHFFINHTVFFKNIINATGTYKNTKFTLALLFTEPFITQKIHPIIPSIMKENCAITHPLLLQCAIIPRRHNIDITTVTETNAAYKVAIASTEHPEDNYSFSRLFTKKSSTDFVPQEQYYDAIAACGSYLMENV